MATLKQKQIFKQGSKTYFYSSLFFPQPVKDDVYTLYSFVRLPDDLIDRRTPQRDAFERYITTYDLAMKGKLIDHPIIEAFVSLSQRKRFDPAWAQAFFRSMRWDIQNRQYETPEQVLEYIYGSAEVIGLFMAKIMDLPEKVFLQAQMLGRAMQYINFIRDIDEDIKLHRHYFPEEVLRRYSLKDLNYSSVKEKPDDFRHFIRDQINLYREWQRQAETGYHCIPRRLRIPIKTAAEMYKWTSRILYEDPLLVYTKKVKPRRRLILARLFIETFTLR